MHFPLLSIIIPVFNTALYLKECIESVLNQSYKNMELILVDDGSTDGSREICDEYANKDNRIVVIHQENGGQSVARNKGLETAQGEYIAFVDADDILAGTDSLEQYVHLLTKDKELDIIQYPISKDVKILKNVIGGGKIIQSFTHTENIYQAWLQDKLITNYVCNKVFKCHLFEQLRFQERMYYEDRHLMCDLIKHCRKIAITTHGGYYYRTHPCQTTQKGYTPYVLQSLIAADLHIVDSIKSYSSLREIYIERYNNCLYYHKLMKKNKWILREDLKSSLKSLCPDWNVILNNRAPLGLKINCLQARFFHNQP